MKIPLMSSSSFFAIFRLPRINSSKGNILVSRTDCSLTSASSASKFGTLSAAGDALHILPQSVPAF